MKRKSEFLEATDNDARQQSTTFDHQNGLCLVMEPIPAFGKTARKGPD